MGAARKLDKDQEDFESKQLSSLEAIASSEPEEVLTKAVEINLIDEDTKEAIKKAMPGHETIFQRALEKAGAGPAAFKKAFRSVYGRFLMERETSVNGGNSKLVAKLKGVLKFEVDDHGIKGRPELQSAARRLKAYAASRKKMLRDATRNIPKIEKKKESIAESKKVAERYLGDIRGISDFADSMEVSASSYGDLSSLLADVNKIDNEIADLESKLAPLSLRIKVDGMSMDEVINFFKLDTKFVFSLSEDQLKEIYERMKVDYSFARNLLEINPSAILTDKDIKDRYRKLMNIFHPDKFSDTSVHTDNDREKSTLMAQIVNRAKETLDNAVSNSMTDPLINDPFEGIDAISSQLEAKRAERDPLAKRLAAEQGKNNDKSKEIAEMLEGFQDGIKVLKRDVNVSGTTKALCDKYLASYLKFTSGPNASDPEYLKGFLKDEVKVFIKELGEALNADIKSYGGGISDAEKEIAGLESLLSDPDGIDAILEKALGKSVDAAELKRLERESHDKAHKKTALEDDHKYFSGDEVKDLQKKYKGIEGSKATAKDVREKKTKLDSKTEDKGKLEELKKQFAEDKTADLQDKFLKLQGLWSPYSKAPSDLDKNITNKAAELDLLRGTIDNYEKSGRQSNLDAINKKDEKLAQLRSNLSLAKAESTSSQAKIDNLVSEIDALESSVAEARERFKVENEKDVTNRSELVRLKGEIADLEKAKTKRDEFKTLFQAFRTDVLSYARAMEKAVSLKMLPDSKAADIKKLKDFFDKLNSELNIDQGQFDDFVKNYSDLKVVFTDVSENVNKELKSSEFGVEEKQEYENDQSKIEKAKTFHTELKPVVEKLVKAASHGVILKTDSATTKTAVEAMEAAFKEIKPDDKDFSAAKVADFYKNHIEGILGDGKVRGELLKEIEAAMVRAEKDAKEAEKALKKAKDSAEKYKNLSDADAAKKIIGAMVYEQFPDISPMDHNKLVTMILAEDVATLQTDEGYEALAQRATAEKSDAATFAGFRTKLLNFKYKEGDKVSEPFKGLKPEDFESWEKMDKLFTFGKLNYEKGTFVLAAFEDFDNGIKSIQSVKLEKKLKTLLAKKLGVDAHMDKAGISKVVDDAFKAQMEKVRPIMKAHAEMAVGEKGKKARENKKHVLDMKYQDLNDQFRSGKFSSEIYDHKLEALIKEAKEAEVDVEFSADSAGAKYWNSPYAQWLKDKLHDAGSFVGKKALAAGVFAPLKIAGKGVWGATKLGTALGFQTALLPVRAAKYPLLLAAKPLVGFINLFRANKWTPLPGLRDSVKNDTARIMGYAKEKATGVAKGTAETVTGTVSGEWGKVKYADTKYADRNKKKADERAELMKIHEPKSDLEAIEVPDSPFVDLAKYKKQIDMVATALGIKIDAPHGAEVKVGHEEKKDDHAKPHDAAHGAHDAHGEKKDDHSKPDAHAEKKDDHAKHDDHKKAA